MTGKRYLRRKRILGISAIVLAVLLMALPVFSRATETTTSLKTGLQIEGKITSDLEYSIVENQNKLTQIMWNEVANGHTNIANDGETIPFYISAKDDHTEIYVYSTANRIYANADSSRMFQDSRPVFAACTSVDGLITHLDTSNVTNMEYMFVGCSALTQLDVSAFDTSNVTNMTAMFNGCSALTQLNVSGFDTSNVTNMGSMFSGCSSLTELDLSGFTVNSGTNVANMIAGCSSLNRINTPNTIADEVDIALPGGEQWYELNADGTYGTTGYTSIPTDRTGSITLVKGSTMPKTAKLKSGDNVKSSIENLYTVSTFGDKFGELTQIVWSDTAVTTGGLDISTGTVISTDDSAYPVYVKPSADYSTLYVYSEAEKIYTNNDTSRLFFSNTANDAGVFLYDNLEQIDAAYLTKLDTSLSTKMGGIFCTGGKYTTIDISSFDTSNVTDMNSMFAGNLSLTSLDVTGLNTSEAIDTSYMFNNDIVLASLDVSNFDTANVQKMDYMFSKLKEITSLNVSGFDTSSVTRFVSMFKGCKALNSLDLSDMVINTTSSISVGGMLNGCIALETIKTPKETHVEINLPDPGTNYAWYEKLGENSYGDVEYDKIPGDLTSSITLVKREKSGTTPTPTPSPTPTPTPTSARSTLVIVDERADKANTDKIAAVVSNHVGNLKLIIKDDDGADIKRIQPLTGGQKLVPYDIYLEDEAGNRYTNFGSCTITLPIPDSLDLTAGRLDVVAAKSSNVLENVSNSKLVKQNVNCVQFTATHFSEYGLLWTPYTDLTPAVPTPTPTPNATQAAATAAAQATSSASGGSGSSGSSSSGSKSGSSSSSSSGSSSSSTSSSKGYTVVPVAGVKGYSNAKDMPKTGDGDVYRILGAIILFLFGSIELVSSIKAKQ